MSEKLNTHYYDGKLSKLYTVDFINKLEEVSKIQKETKIACFQKLVSLVKTKQGLRNLQTIIRDLEKFGRSENSPNYDGANKLHTCDLLMICCELLGKDDAEKVDDFLQLFNIQLAEMSSGMCAQGRTTRLFQIINTMIEN